MACGQDLKALEISRQMPEKISSPTNSSILGDSDDDSELHS